MILFADAYLHTLSPFAIEFPASWPLPGLRWYGLAYAFGFLIGWLLLRWVSRKSWSPLPPQAVGDLVFAIILGVLLGARLGYALFYQIDLFYTFTDTLPYWNLLAINQGGMASHGGMIGVIIAVMWFARRRRISALHIFDIIAVGVCIGLGVGRVANFLNAELWGKALPAHMQSDPPWWSVKYPHELRDFETAQLAPLTNVVHEVGRSAGEWLSALARVDVDPAAANFVQATIDRLIAATQHGNDAVIAAIRPMLTAYYPSQIFQAITDGPIMLAALLLIWLKPRKPGVVGAWWLVLYGVLRIVTEVFRQPDEGVALTFGILSRGQTLSALMVLIGVLCLIIVTRRPVQPIGGFFRK